MVNPIIGEALCILRPAELRIAFGQSIDVFDPSAIQREQLRFARHFQTLACRWMKR
jgi:hypothetical protein